MTTKFQIKDIYDSKVRIEVCNGLHGVAIELNSYDDVTGIHQEHLAIEKAGAIQLARAIIAEFPEDFV